MLRGLIDQAGIGCVFTRREIRDLCSGPAVCVDGLGEWAASDILAVITLEPHRNPN